MHRLPIVLRRPFGHGRAMASAGSPVSAVARLGGRVVVQCCRACSWCPRSCSPLGRLRVVGYPSPAPQCLASSSLRCPLRSGAESGHTLLCGGRSVKTAQRRGRRTQLSKRAVSAQFDLLERDAELAAVEALINASPSGGRLLAIGGHPGSARAAEPLHGLLPTSWVTLLSSFDRWFAMARLCAGRSRLASEVTSTSPLCSSPAPIIGASD